MKYFLLFVALIVCCVASASPAAEYPAYAANYDQAVDTPMYRANDDGSITVAWRGRPDLPVLGGFCSTTCADGVCGAPLARVASVSVRIASVPVRIVQARPVRRLLSVRPVRRVLNIRPLQRIASVVRARPLRRVLAIRPRILFRRWR